MTVINTDPESIIALCIELQHQMSTIVDSQQSFLARIRYLNEIAPTLPNLEEVTENVYKSLHHSHNTMEDTFHYLTHVIKLMEPLLPLTPPIIH